ncbi:MAG TPA: ATP-binding protein [Candidatus Coprenecus avistercoris]|uniref:ATP-binding protein n=1 Tax=Candidatus Coprenecus avistercoris TaxID=2840730 RepID=A0A9D1E1G9_9BACT|nr:ATP-binding protein [Candidatus Coprenecus avistercoris]
MDAQQQRLFPVGRQDFAEIRTEGNFLYVDKTEYVYRMTHSDAKFIFLSRPRRFGKSLLVSTLKYYFQGRRKLFQGLAIDSLEKEWVEYPVLHFDMSIAKHMEREQLEAALGNQLSWHEREYGIVPQDKDANLRLKNLIETLYRLTGRQVVILIDEYDAPLLDVVHEDTALPVLRNVMRNFYSPLKACDQYLKFVFMTGITKFSQLSIFSELNNIRNISMDASYAAVCGITEEEMLTQMSADIDMVAGEMALSREQLLEKLKSYYDGYHFTWPSPDIYNPFSLVCAFADRKIGSYWFGSGTPTYLIEMLRKFHVAPSQIGGGTAMAADFDAPTERMTGITPLLYQSGYITIKEYDQDADIFTLNIPNKEVRIGLMRSLLPYYVSAGRSIEASTTIARIYLALRDEDLDGAFRLLQTFLGTVPYTDNIDYEGHYQQMLYIIFSLLGYYVDVEVRTPRGRVDMVLRTATTLYVVEVKLDKSAETAMQQIDPKQYPERLALCGLPVVKVAVNFDREAHNISDWIISK